MSKVDQITLNDHCIDALADKIDDVSWIQKYQWLYNQCSIKPHGRPSISLAFHQGEYFEEMDEFVTRYSNLIEPLEHLTDEDHLNIHE
jgi:hypothetical protein